ncbi:hypothetical protein TVAG_182760 [Trichomonas vaginalis G3]|uniref:DUF3447 domain-containing protein n=1 Tax=Trichomonas vaginalis (strain ATCC PRA-98 / G3) TaxID=412133 RepID=A2D914_TRIV3|nr:ankyrin repeat and SOCS box-containing protein 4 family [Trichomonas vaginalis G3]EAY23040.1 hypothetical protein TVAG_182760 [Trichomonas vaginalis G3]KAI5519009.1 ankyrin repeat and SOCS box-containing protein 4 family [Trichomonas vaginalis G3]|eukprot:XP_001584026.1 hypothetical protein [Trichomonas vaginalis G3]
MSHQVIVPSKYSELRNIHKNYIDSYIALYQLKTTNEKELNSIYNMIKTNLIDSNKYLPQNIIKDILNIILYNNRYTKSYLSLVKQICDDYHITEVMHISKLANKLFYIEYGIKLDKADDLGEIKLENIDIHSENAIYKAIMNNDVERFIYLTEKEEFDQVKNLKSSLYTFLHEGYSMLELCCYHGAVDCFKILRTKFYSEITQKCLQFSFLGGNPEIMSECLKYQKPDRECMKYAIISHKIDFVTFLMYEYNIEIDLLFCGIHKNLDAFLVYFDQTNDVNKCFVYSPMFSIPSLCEYFFSLGANINARNQSEKTSLHIAASYNNTEIIEFLLSHGANIDAFNYDGKTALQIAAFRANKESIELLISHGANINSKSGYGGTALLDAAFYDCKEIIELLLSHGANINEKDHDDQTALHIATKYNCKETIEVLLSYGANVNEEDMWVTTALHLSIINENKEIAELLLTHGADVNAKDQDGETALHKATYKNNKEIVELLLSHGANINEKDFDKETALDIASKHKYKEVAEVLLSHGANFNEK